MTSPWVELMAPEVMKWHLRMLELAQHVAGWSKDPSTRVGAVIVRRDNTIASVGYNGFPRGVPDTGERLQAREEKYPRTVHAEINAIINAHGPVHDYRLYVTPLHPCAQCSAVIIQAGISAIYTVGAEQPERWSADGRIAKEMLDEAGIPLFALWP